ncbi:LSM domain protein [Staphylococcus delphini]|uniref:LSM domain protein n=1 Tax=Staphylococcus delphini TaxID=53344 RepID=UPI0023B2EA07|nr:LSM domain protein [Staphylococcus delphini]MDE9752299.1 LSM domain protein [Staphylococcus delphini]MDE9789732.1 LSM domain protein [Staphylococcus delphini]MDE9793120.1 LSM domain protein [Staphylococcus delphini]MDE9794598.1 LSM domain protein [Staphylococcus delphini]MDE9798019.1 LSM domain protein [Staphylococcus delphini]
MKLWLYVGRYVRIEVTDGEQFVGKAVDYEDEIANNSGEDSICLDIKGGLVEFDESEIKSIVILD